jgi:type IV secretory pathway ATPase VirB11/archaellum biosynthesis ATPase
MAKPTKQQLIDALTAQNIELTGTETVDELKKLIEDNSITIEEAQAEGEPITVKYRDHKGETTERTFSQEVHGKDFAKLAAEFKETNASRIIA